MRLGYVTFQPLAVDLKPINFEIHQLDLVFYSDNNLIHSKTVK